MAGVFEIIADAVMVKVVVFDRFFRYSIQNVFLVLDEAFFRHLVTVTDAGMKQHIETILDTVRNCVFLLLKKTLCLSNSIAVLFEMCTKV
mgnify:CR=1 FL=1